MTEPAAVTIDPGEIDAIDAAIFDVGGVLTGGRGGAGLPATARLPTRSKRPWSPASQIVEPESVASPRPHDTIS